MAAAAKSLQSFPTLCGPIDGSPPGSRVPGILQARTLERITIAFSSAWKWKVKVKLLCRVQLLATPWTAAYQAPPSMGFSRQEYWSGLPLPSPLYLCLVCFNFIIQETLLTQCPYDWILIPFRRHVYLQLPYTFSPASHSVCWKLFAERKLQNWDMFWELKVLDLVSAHFLSFHVVFVVQSLSSVWFFATLWIVALQASLSFTISWSLLRSLCTESVMPSNHLILCHHFSPLALLLPQCQVFSSMLDELICSQ